MKSVDHNFFSNLQNALLTGVAFVVGVVKLSFGAVFLNIDFANDIEAIITGGMSALFGAVLVYLFNKIVKKKK